MRLRTLVRTQESARGWATDADHRGTARGRKLVGPSSEGTRPLSDRARESLFNILGPGIRGERVLDLFAGTGAVGLEALSRGALSATFVEQGRAALGDIRANLSRSASSDQGSVVAGDALGFIVRTREQFDVIFAGPPQWAELWSKTLVAIDQRDRVLAEGGLLVTQLDPPRTPATPSCLDPHPGRRTHLRPHASALPRARLTSYASPPLPTTEDGGDRADRDQVQPQLLHRLRDPERRRDHQGRSRGHGQPDARASRWRPRPRAGS